MLASLIFINTELSQT